MSSRLLVRSYSKITNRSSDVTELSTDSGVFAKETNIDVISLYDLHVSQAVRLPLPPKNETVSHPVKAWNIGKAIHRSGPSILAIS